MRKINTLLGGALAAAVLGIAAGGPAQALSMKECSAKFQAAKKDGTLAGLDWKTYRAKQCAAGTSAASSAGTSSAISGSILPRCRVATAAWRWPMIGW